MAAAGFAKVGRVSRLDERPRGNVIHETTRVVRDVNGDGLLDIVEPSAVTLSPYAPTGLLARLERGPGAVTEVSWASSAWSEPAGMPDEVSGLASHKPVVAELLVTDPVTDQSALEERTYADGARVDGVFQGFATTTSTTWFHDPKVATAFPSAEWLLRSEVTTTFDLHRDFTVETGRTIAGPANVDWIEDPQRAAGVVRTRTTPAARPSERPSRGQAAARGEVTNAVRNGTRGCSPRPRAARRRAGC